MPWWSINPKTESKAAVNLAAHIIGTTPEEITPTEMAQAYNQAEGYEGEDESRVNNFVDSISSLLDEEVDEDE